MSSNIADTSEEDDASSWGGVDDGTLDTDESIWLCAEETEEDFFSFEEATLDGVEDCVAEFIDDEDCFFEEDFEDEESAAGKLRIVCTVSISENPSDEEGFFA